MKYLCTNCSYIYDEDLGDKLENITPWTKFEDLKENFKCPVCSCPKDLFHEIKEEVIYLNEKAQDLIEAEHFINYKFDWNIIKISVWNPIAHPSWEEHRITSIWLYDEYWDLIYEKFFAIWEEAYLEFEHSFIDIYEIRARCSIHWTWWRIINN